MCGNRSRKIPQNFSPSPRWWNTAGKRLENSRKTRIPRVGNAALNHLVGNRSPAFWTPTAAIEKVFIKHAYKMRYRFQIRPLIRSSARVGNCQKWLTLRVWQIWKAHKYLQLITSKCNNLLRNNVIRRGKLVYNGYSSGGGAELGHVKTGLNHKQCFDRYRSFWKIFIYWIFDVTPERNAFQNFALWSVLQCGTLRSIFQNFRSIFQNRIIFFKNLKHFHDKQ